MPDPRRYYIDQGYLCPECLNSLQWRSRADRVDSLVLEHPDFECSRRGLLYYAPPIELTVYKPDVETAEAVTAPAKVYYAVPWDTFKGPTCKGSYQLGTACGKCDRCAWERMLPGFTHA